MDFRQITQPAQHGPGRPATPSAAPEPEHKPEKHTSGKSKPRNLLQLFNGIMLIGIAVLIALVALATTRSGSAGSQVPDESQYVAADKYQAVFLGNDQVYFGHITSINGDYIRMTDVYYPTKNAETSNNYTLIKFGCQQIHYPYDQIMINRAQVTFWENLHDDGKVVRTIKQFKEQNPNGPDCTQAATDTQSDTSASGTTKTGTDQDTDDTSR